MAKNNGSRFFPARGIQQVSVSPNVENGNGKHPSSGGTVTATFTGTENTETSDMSGMLMPVHDLNTVREALKKRRHNGKMAWVLCGGFGGNFLEEVVELDPARYGDFLRILVLDLDLAGIQKSFRELPDSQVKLEKWIAAKAITILALGGAESDGFGAGANPEVGEAAARNEETSTAIKAWLEDEDIEIVVVFFASGGGSGAGAAPVVIEYAAKKLVFPVVIMPNKKEGRWESATKVLRKVEKMAPTLVRQNQSMFEWLKQSMTPDDFKKITRKGAWKRVNRLILQIGEMFLNIMIDTGDTQNIDIKNLRRAAGVKNGDESQHLFSGRMELTAEEMKAGFEVDPKVAVARLVDDPLGIAGVVEKLDYVLLQLNGGWSLEQSEAILDGVRETILGPTPEDRDVFVFSGASEETGDKHWSIELFGFARNVTPGESPSLVIQPKTGTPTAPLIPSIFPVPPKPADMAGLSVRTILPKAGIVQEKVTTESEKEDVKPETETAAPKSTEVKFQDEEGIERAVMVSLRLAIDFRRSYDNTSKTAKEIAVLLDHMQEETKSAEFPEGIRPALPDRLKPKVETPPSEKKRGKEFVKALFSAPRTSN